MRDRQYVALVDMANRPGWPSKSALWALVRRRKIRRFKFAGDKKTYVLRSEIERAVRMPEVRK